MPDVDRIDLKKLRYFVVVAQTGNIGRAASILEIHPATLGRVITSFEEELGFDLYQKYSKGIVLTTKGKRLLALGPEILRNVERIYSIGEKFTQKKSVIVGVPFSLGPQLIGSLHSDFKASLPTTDITFFEADSLEIETKVISGHIDVAMIYNPPEVYGLVCDPVLEEPMLFVYPPSWNFKPPERPLLLREIQDCPLVLSYPSFSERRYLGRLEQQSGIRLLPAIEVASSTTINAIVNRGLACTIALAHSVARDVLRGYLVSHPIGRPISKMTLNLVTSKGVLDNTSIVSLMACIRSTIETLVREGHWIDAELVPNKRALI